MHFSSFPAGNGGSDQHQKCFNVGINTHDELVHFAHEREVSSTKFFFSFCLGFPHQLVPFIDKGDFILCMRELDRSSSPRTRKSLGGWD
jgi:hypothetical protein